MESRLGKCASQTEMCSARQKLCLFCRVYTTAVDVPTAAYVPTAADGFSAVDMACAVVTASVVDTTFEEDIAPAVDRFRISSGILYSCVE